MQKTQMTKTYGNGFDHMANKQAQRDFIAWWNDRSHFPFAAAAEPKQDFAMAA
ncbi:hypothetical protein [Defluviimonas sp. WL0075]|uniref:Uncharacterized protein n=1 Tax=Albidovulum sediminicola TaxID=2984331 RepID=A0ABT2YZB2_9RHOB|nr:hypothetical protein [Defluviimonas sp. WL0075]MCV2864198.1 hypothetical protein [Defluviimonas sp. WL0075]